MGLNWSITTVIMCRNSDGWPRCQRPVKLVATGKIWHHLSPFLLWITTTTDNDDVNIVRRYCEI
jgi:hypothetical protein